MIVACNLQNPIAKPNSLLLQQDFYLYMNHTPKDTFIRNEAHKERSMVDWSLKPRVSEGNMSKRTREVLMAASE
jgi:hypothetical protein